MCQRSLQKCLPKLLKKRNLTAIPLILIPEYGQSNATLDTTEEQSLNSLAPNEFIFTGLGERGWRSGESTRLPPMWPGFDSRTRRHMWVEFVVGSRPCSERFFSGYSGFLRSSKTNISKFQFDLESVPN